MESPKDKIFYPNFVTAETEKEWEEAARPNKIKERGKKTSSINYGNNKIKRSKDPLIKLSHIINYGIYF